VVTGPGWPGGFAELLESELRGGDSDLGQQSGRGGLVGNAAESRPGSWSKVKMKATATIASAVFASTCRSSQARNDSPAEAIRTTAPPWRKSTRNSAPSKGSLPALGAEHHPRSGQAE
jgi:hypothetical protein